MTTAVGPSARLLQLPDSFTEVNTVFYERGWTDGLPILPPTEAAVAEMLRWTDRDPLAVVGVLPPRQGEATVEKIAINALMAGCQPQYLPVVIAAIEAIANPEFNADAVQATTHPVAPFLIVSGPIAQELQINSGYNCFGQGFRANATIGRAVRLIMMNVGGGLPGSGDRSTQGSPAKFSYCIAENAEANPWQPLNVEFGYPADVTIVTVRGCEGPHNIQDHYSITGEDILRTIAGSMGQAGSNNILSHGHPVLTLSPEHAATIARDGFSKQDVKQYVFEHARYPVRLLGKEFTDAILGRVAGFDASDPDAMLQIMAEPADMTVIVAGGSGKHSSWQPTFGHDARPVTLPLTRADGTPIRSIDELHRG